jgi:hypothetical protein
LGNLWFGNCGEIIIEKPQIKILQNPPIYQFPTENQSSPRKIFNHQQLSQNPQKKNRIRKFSSQKSEKKN